MKLYIKELYKNEIYIFELDGKYFIKYNEYFYQKTDENETSIFWVKGPKNCSLYSDKFKAQSYLGLIKFRLEHKGFKNYEMKNIGSWLIPTPIIQVTNETIH